MVFKALIPLALLAAVNAGFAGFAPLHHNSVNSLPHQDVQLAVVPEQMQMPAVHPGPAQPASQEFVSLQKTILKTVQVPVPVDKYVKVDRHIPVPVTRYYRVDRPYEVIKYIQQPYFVKVPKKIEVPIITKVPVPQPIIEIEPVLPEPQYIVRNNDVPHHVSHPLPSSQPQSQYLPPSQDHLPTQPQSSYGPPH